jgi:hypothetical protein
MTVQAGLGDYHPDAAHESSDQVPTRCHRHSNSG